MYEVSTKTRRSMFELAQQSLLKVGLVAALLLPTASNGGVLAESDLQKVESLKPLFANLMNDLTQTARRSDLAAGDVELYQLDHSGAPSNLRRARKL